MRTLWKQAIALVLAATAAVAPATASLGATRPVWFYDPGHHSWCWITGPRYAGTHRIPDSTGAMCENKAGHVRVFLDDHGKIRTDRYWYAPGPAPLLRYGHSVTAWGFRLTSERAGMLVVVAHTGHGFLITPSGRVVREG